MVLGWVSGMVVPAALAASSVQLPPPPALPAGPRRVAVLPLRSDGTELQRTLSRAITAGLIAEVDELNGVDPIAPARVMAALRSYDLDPDRCAGDIACVARAGRYAGAHMALESQLAALAGGSILSVRLIDSQSQRSLVRVAEPISGTSGGAAIAAQLHRIAIQIFAPDEYVGSLAIECTADGAGVYLDDNLVGTTPLPAPLADLRAGRHILRLTKPGLPDFNGFADVVYRRRAAVEVDVAKGVVTRRTVSIDSAAGIGSLIVFAGESEVMVRVDGEPIGMTPFSRPIEVAAGTHQVVLRKEGLSRLARRIEVRAGQRSQLTLRAPHSRFEIAQFEIVPLDAPLPEIEVPTVRSRAGSGGGRMLMGVVRRSGPTWRLWSGLVAAGLGAVSLGVMGFFSDRVATARRERDAFATAYVHGSYTGAEIASLNDTLGSINSRGEQAALGQWVSLGVGIGLLAAGGSLVLLDLLAPGETTATATSGPRVSGIFSSGVSYVTAAMSF